MAWLRAYAAATSQTASHNTILRAAVQHPEDVPSRQTAAAYSEHLARLWMLDPTPGWLPTRNPFRRLGQAEKHSLADPALAARLLGVGPEALLAGTPSTMAQPRHAGLLGALFESLVGLSLKTYAQASEASVFHLRTQGGEHEIDFIVERPDHRVLAFEVKVTRAVEDRHVRHLHWLKDHLGDDLIDSCVITTGPYAYRRQDGIAVIPAALLGP